jgi:hypothetical protein
MAKFLYMVQVGSQDYIRMYNFFFPFHILLIDPIWLNWFMDNCHLGYITKLKKYKKKNTGVHASISDFFFFFLFTKIEPRLNL